MLKHVFNVRKTKRVAKFDGLEPRRCEYLKGIVAPEIGPKIFGTLRNMPQQAMRMVHFVAVKQTA